MGQQQLLLLVLGIVIVGIAVVGGIQAFSEGKDKAQQDAAVSDAMRIITDVQAWSLKPAAFGGGSDTTFSAVTFGALGITPNAQGEYVTTSGCFSLAAEGNNAKLTIKGKQDDSCGTQIATVVISGADPDDVDWTYGSGTGG